MSDLAVRFEDASEMTFYKILATLTSMKGEGIGKVRFEERRVTARLAEYNGWYGEVHFLSREAMEIFGKKIRGRTCSSNA